jgi:NHL repeat
MSIFRSAFERILGLRVWALVIGLLVLGGVTAVVAQTNPTGSGSGVVSTFAGSGVAGFVDGSAGVAQFNFPVGVAADGSGNVYVSEPRTNRIRKVDSLGVVSTFAGSGVAGFVDGPASVAQLNYPVGVAVDGFGNVLVADVRNHRIRKVDSLGVVSTFAGSGVAGFVDGPAGIAQFNEPHGVAVDGSGNVFVSDTNNNRIRKVDSLGVVSTFAGTGVRGFVDGPAGIATLSAPLGVAVDGSGNVFVADWDQNRIRKVDSLGAVSTLAGSLQGFVDGPAGIARFKYPFGLVVDGFGNVLVADVFNQRIRKVDSLGVVSTFAGSGVAGFVDGPGGIAQFNEPYGVAVDGLGNVYVADSNNHRIRKIGASSGQPTTTTAQPTTTTAQPTTTTSQPTTTTAQPATTTSQPTTSTTVQGPLGVLTAKIVRGANNATGASAYTVTLRMAGVVSGASYEFVVPSGHVPEPLAPDPATQRYPRTAVDGVVEWIYSLKAPRGVFSAKVFSAGGTFALSSIEVK